MTEIPENRDLTSAERSLTRWLLEHGGGRAKEFHEYVDRIHVISKCRCGCASVNFELDGRGWHSRGGMEILSDYQWHDAAGRRFGVFVFAKDEALAGLEVWSIDGLATPMDLPDIAWLRPN
jgi:hypothetical protein